MAPNYCPSCGATRTAEAKSCGRCGAPFAAVATSRPASHSRRSTGVRVPTPLFVVAASLLFFGTLFFLFVVLYGGVQHAWDTSQNSSSVAYYNTTDELLCASSSSPPCGAEIKPHATSYWAKDCWSAPIAVVTVSTQDGRKLYERGADCDDWTGEFVVINKRDGEFVVNDSLPSTD